MAAPEAVAPLRFLDRILGIRPYPLSVPVRGVAPRASLRDSRDPGVPLVVASRTGELG